MNENRRMFEDGMNVYTYIVIVLCGVHTLAHGQRLTNEQEVIAETLLGEARGEGKGGMYAVACIIKQRMINRKQTAQQVCLARGQFDYWTQHKRAKWDDQNRANVRRLMQSDTELVRYAKALAVSINKLDLNYTKNADHYCTLGTHNYWTKGKTPVVIVGKHKFYKLR